MKSRTVRLPAEPRMRAFGLLYENDVLTDCTFFCRDGSVRAHRIVLASSSGYFRDVFTGYGAQPNALLIMLGVGVAELRRLLELIYTGSIDVPADRVEEVCRLAGELKVSGLAVEEDTNESQTLDNRDTRFKGTKRVAVDYDDDELSPTPSPKAAKSCVEKSGYNERTVQLLQPIQPQIDAPIENGLLLNNQLGLEETFSSQSEDLELSTAEDPELSTNNIVTREDSFRDDENYVGHSVDETCKLSVWARRERKFKCELCTSSFKRASHLSRHQLVHTGERPFACDRCEKAFSRHDKLKHHINKAHDPRRSPPTLPPEALYTIKHVELIAPLQEVKQEEGAPSTSQKKSRGRPRKYPKVPPSAVKRPRGRPRIRPIVPIAERTPKRPRGRPRVHPIVQDEAPEEGAHDRVPETDNPETFNEETNESKISIECGLMEPLVEIKTEKPSNDPQGPTDSNHFFENIGLFENSSAIGKIGECTISVATATNAAAPTPGVAGPPIDEVLRLNVL